MNQDRSTEAQRKCPVCGAALSYNPWLRRYEDAERGTRHYCYLDPRQLTANIQECTCGEPVLVYSDRKLDFDSRTPHLCDKRRPTKRPQRKPKARSERLPLRLRY